jgi:two-component system phosphate regulon response regulator PhoB/two-component system alkaline phosphatase synthesis response regulator PhoP
METGDTAMHITVLDDEPDILHLVTLHLEKAGFSVEGYTDAKGFMRSLDRSRPDLILLDLMLPDADGFEICSSLKREPRFSAIPIIILTAKGQETDKVTGLDLGADDYITKPFSPREFVARVRAVLRRSGHEEQGTITIGGNLVIDPERFEVRSGPELITLTQAEFRILHLLASNRGRVFTREKILDHLWGTEKAVLDRTVDVHIKNLRDKLGSCGKLITNIRGVGYKMEA